MYSVVPDVPADYVGRPPRPGKLVELLLAEEAYRMMLEARKAPLAQGDAQRPCFRAAHEK